jgi:hypothetical protein
MAYNDNPSYLPLTGGTLSGALILNADPTTALGASTKQYVDNAITAVNPATSVLAASTTGFTVVYFNGVSGVGATLTNAGAQAAFLIDGQSPIVGQRVLIKNQGSTFQNGVYTVTVIGTGLTNWVLTRALDYDQSSDINNTGVINVLSGTVNALTGWLINSSVTNIGTDAITYTQYNAAPISTTQYAVLVGGASNSVASVGPGSAGQALLSGGAAANPAYSTPTYPSASGSSGQVIISNGTNNVYSTPTFPNASATARKIIVSDGTNWTASTETYAVPGASGNILTSDGTNWTSATPSGALLVVSGALTSLQIKALHGTPIQIIAAAGSGKVVEIIGTIASMQYGGNNTFTASGGQFIGLYFGTTNVITSIVANAQITSITSTYTTANVGTSNNAWSTCTNTAIYLYNSVPTEITGNASNDNTISYNIIYRIITMP